MTCSSLLQPAHPSQPEVTLASTSEVKPQTFPFLGTWGAILPALVWKNTQTLVQRKWCTWLMPRLFQPAQWGQWPVSWFGTCILSTAYVCVTPGHVAEHAGGCQVESFPMLLLLSCPRFKNAVCPEACAHHFPPTSWAVLTFSGRW